MFESVICLPGTTKYASIAAAAAAAIETSSVSVKFPPVLILYDLI